ncbi:MAG TPA: hypothetical protein VK658_04595 [Chryseolinea sp.]|nr:hypothetical protein [Chryseolinea sp.]
MNGNRVTHKKYCERCGVEFRAGLASSRFCSARCRAASWRSEKNLPVSERERQIDRLESTQQEPQTRPNKVSAETQFLMDFWEERAEYWERAYMDERKVSMEWEEKYDCTASELRDQVLNQKLLNRKIEIFEKSKPSGLNGLAENPLLMKLAEHVGPALADLVTRLGDGDVNSKAKRANLRPGESSHYIQLPLNLPEDRRIKIIEIMRDMAALSLQDLDVMVDSILKGLQEHRRVNTDNQ